MDCKAIVTRTQRLRTYLIALTIGTLILARAPSLLAQTDNAFLLHAIVLAHQVQRETGIPSSVILAQAILETGWGRKPIADANNFFGIKASQQPDGTINTGSIAIGWTWASTQEWDGSKFVDQRERFRTYRTMADSFQDLGQLYSATPRYAPAMAAIGDPREFAHRVAAAGFATDPTYADKLIELMDAQDLYQYDIQGDQAELVGQSDSPTVYPGQFFEIYLDVKNTGLSTWRENEDYYLANENDSSMGAAARQVPAGEIAPEASTRWTIRLVAPRQPGVYRTEWRLVHGIQPFGAAMYVEVTVRAGERGLDRLVMALLVIAAGLAALALTLAMVRAHYKVGANQA